MSKEMIVSCSSQETKIAILEEDQVSELYFERGKEYSLAGSIYKGRVTRVLPGMQSAFVDIGLERDAFLYVSDFLEDTEEYDRIASTVEEKVIRMEETAMAESSVARPIMLEPSPGVEVEPGTQDETSASAGPRGDSTLENAPPEKAPRAGSSRGAVLEKASPPAEPYVRFSRHSRRRRPHHKGFPESKYARQPVPAPPASPPTSPPIILPGESLAKYKEWSRVEPAQPQTEGTERVAEADAAAYPESSPSSPSLTQEAVTESVYPKGGKREQGTGNREEETPVAGSVYPKEEQPEPPPPHGPANAAATEEQREIESRDGEAVSSEMVRATEQPMEQPKQQPEEKSTDIPQSHIMDQEIQAAAGRERFPLMDQPRSYTTDQAQPLTEVPPISPGPSPAEDALSAAATFESAGSPIAESVMKVGPEGSKPESAAAKIESAEGGTGESVMPQSAAVREKQRNPRYMRRGRWASRKEGRAEVVRSGSRPTEREAPQPLIADLLKEGQEIIVQIAKEPLGKKGARITSHVALPGRYLVFMPTVDHVGVSRKIASDEERQRLKRIILEHSRNIPGGFIVRTAGEGHSEEDFRQDILYLSGLWAEMKAQAEKSSAPALLHHDLNLVQRTVRDQLSVEFSAVWVDNEPEYEKVLSLVSKFQPSLVNRVKLYTKDVPLFDELGIQEEINKALKPKVWLKSGGYIVINQTEALVAIDVNTGKFVGKSNRLEDTIVKTNVEAIREIVRQIRLRDLGGIIVVDFIDMDEKKNRQKVMAAMEEALKADRSPSKILSFNEFGLVAITRKRVRQSLERTLCQPCSYCGGSGLVKSVATVCCEILSEARKLASQLERKQITLRVNPEVGKALKARDMTILQEIEEMTGKAVIIRNDPTLHTENFDFN